jgi:hypothetical protein
MKNRRKIDSAVRDKFEKYCRNLGDSTLTHSELIERCEDFVHKNNSGFDEGYAYYAYSLKDNKIFWEHDLGNIFTHEKGDTYKKETILSLTHESHRGILAYLLYGLFPIFSDGKFKDDLYNKKFFFRVGRSFLEKGTGQYWWVVQTIYPLEFDENNSLLSFFSSVLIEDKYRGDAVFVNIVRNFLELPSENEKAIQQRFQNHRNTVLDYIGFTDTEKEILATLDSISKDKINYGKDDYTYKKIALILDMETSTLKKNYDNMRDKAKPYSLNNSFKSIFDLVIFLKNSEFLV